MKRKYHGSFKSHTPIFVCGVERIDPDSDGTHGHLLVGNLTHFRQFFGGHRNGIEIRWLDVVFFGYEMKAFVQRRENKNWKQI